MSQVETIALWAGLISSIAGIVLSIAALVFGVLVNNRATEVNDQTIKSLQKIESDVERLSDDTRGLIKAGWDKMLGNFGATAEPPDNDDEGKQEIASGLAQEARADLGLTEEGLRQNPGMSPELIERLEKVLINVEQSIATQLKSASQGSSPAKSMDRLINQIRRLSPEAQSLVAALREPGHLDRKQYRALTKSNHIGPALNELRREGLLVPLSGVNDKGEEIPVYWFPPRMSKRLSAALSFLPDASSEINALVRDELKKVGYFEQS